jgi:pimeloyl-ACP methyl ester carboxylesterase
MSSISAYSGPMNPQSNTRRLWLLLFSAALFLSALACSSASGPGEPNAPLLSTQEFDPASADPAAFDLVNPPVISEVSFSVEGAALNAIVYEAQGPGPHPTVVLLHGFPGNERNLDLAQAIRRAGWNVVFFHYRGAWGSGGEFSFLHVIEDVHAVVGAIAEPEFAEQYRIDASRLALVGHSMGGFAALVAGAELPAIECVVSLSGANLGALAQVLANDPQQAAGFAASIDGWSGPIKGPSGRVLIAEIVEHAERFDTRSHVADLAQKKLLLVAGRRDVVTPPALHHDPLVEVLRAADSKSLEALLFEQADHAYSGQRIELARLVTGWLDSECDATDPL